MTSLFGTSLENESWLSTTLEEMLAADSKIILVEDVGSGALVYDCSEYPPLAAYFRRLKSRADECSWGNFSLWAWERVLTEGRDPLLVGARTDLVVIADWMLDSEYCAVDISNGTMVFLGGDTPRVSSLGFLEFMSRVFDDPMTPHGMM